MSPVADNSPARVALSGKEWRVGYCYGGAQRGSYLLLWPIGDGLWDLTFQPKVSFDGVSGEDVYLISDEDDAAIMELDRAEIEWAPSVEIAELAALDFFPESRVAHAIGRALGRPQRADPPKPRHVDTARALSNPWQY